MIWFMLHVIGVVLGLGGMALVALGRAFLGQVVWIVANAAMIAWALGAGDGLTAGLFAGYEALTLFGVGREVWRHVR